MSYTYADLARSVVATDGGRSTSGVSLTITTGDGSRFGSPTPSAPMRLAVYRGVPAAFVTLLKVTGVSGDVLTIDGAMDGHADAAVLPGDQVANVPTAGDFTALWTTFAALQAVVDFYHDTPPPPVAAFSADVTTGDAPIDVTLTDASTNKPTTWAWTIPELSLTSTVRNPTFTISDNGTYSVQLVVGNGFGSDTLLKSNYLVFSSSPIDTVFSDDFNRADTSAGGVGSPWSDPSTAWQIKSNTLFCSTAGFFTKPLVVDTGINHASGKTMRATMRVASNAQTSPFVWGRCDSTGAVGDAMYGGGGQTNQAWQGGGDPHGGFAMSYTSPAVESTIGAYYVIKAYMSGDCDVFALHEVGEDLPYAVAGRDVYAALQGTGTSDYGIPFYTNTYLAVSPFNGTTTIDDFVVETQVPGHFVLCDGDSITCFGWPLSTIPFLGLDYQIRNTGVPSQEVAGMTTRFDSVPAPEMTAAKARGQSITYVMAGGTNDLLSVDAATLITRVQALIAKVAAYGVDKIVVTTLLYRDGSGGAAYATHAPKVDAYNAWLRSNAASLGVVVADWAADSRMSDPHDATVFQSDLTHPTGLGNFYLAQDSHAAIS